jgi:cation diffusion facilitator CzcD-associated flavoprotein CzcO
MNYHDYIILGAGPAGLQMGYFMEQAGHDYLIIEGNGCAASFFTHYPRHGTLISISKRFNWFPEADFNLRHDWNSLITHDSSHLFKDYSTELYPKSADVVRYANDFAVKFGLKNSI